MSESHPCITNGMRKICYKSHGIIDAWELHLTQRFHFFLPNLSFVASLSPNTVFVCFLLSVLKPKPKSHIIAIWWKESKIANLNLPRLHGSKANVIHPSTYPPIYPSIHPSIHPSLHPFFHLLIYALNIHLVSSVPGTLLGEWSSSWNKWAQMTIIFLLIAPD